MILILFVLVYIAFVLTDIRDHLEMSSFFPTKRDHNSEL